MKQCEVPSLTWLPHGDPKQSELCCRVCLGAPSYLRYEIRPISADCLLSVLLQHQQQAVYIPGPEPVPHPPCRVSYDSRAHCGVRGFASRAGDLKPLRAASSSG